MNSKHEIEEQEDSFEEIDGDHSPTVDDFIKELEAKEKDLHITADMTIEIAESDFDPGSIPSFIHEERSTVLPSLAGTGHTPSSLASTSRHIELEQENEALRDQITGIRAERNEIQAKSDRRLSDFENYKYRMDRERRGAFINQISNLASQMLPVLDNLERALNSALELPEEKRADFQQFFEGIVLVNQQVSEVFAGMGVQPIPTIGELFDPNLHEAVATEERHDLPHNTISAEMLRGYRIGNRVIRHSMVKVTTSPQAIRADSQRESENTPTDPNLESTNDLSEQGHDPESDVFILETE
jgi:molecular chaperone GrpE